MDNALLSIIIPTKNRQEYAISVVEQILSIKSNDIEVVVQDNSDVNSLENMLDKFKNDKRLVYNYSCEVLSFVDNFSYAVNNSSGEFLCIIGDDDGINPEIIKFTKWIKSNDIDVAKFDATVTYHWPNSGMKYKNYEDNGIMLFDKISKRVKKCDVQNGLKKLLADGCQNYLFYDIPKLYHGIVRAEKVREIYNSVGKFFGGLSPDIYSAVSLALVNCKTVSTRYPYTISGACGSSGSADSHTGRHVGKIEEAPHFRGHDTYEWHRFVPKFYSVENIWADSALHAFEDFKRDDLIKMFSVRSLILHNLLKHPNYKEILVKHYVSFLKEDENFKKEIHKLDIDVKKLKYRNFIKKCISKIKRGLHKTYVCTSINNIREATEALQSYLEMGGKKRVQKQNTSYNRRHRLLR